ncbi:MAG TPA: DUF1549 domain-containing protein [Pirellulaceae bacterium]|nr:DUF1549 domain-containing protein [Pirellulaceae bacterium]
MLRFICLSLASCLVLALAGAALAEAPLHERIDALIAAQAGGAVNGPATDAEFVRRVHLDLVGRIPTRDEAQRFFDDTAADKRTLLIDALLASTEHPARLSDVFHVMLTERLGDHPEWNAWLQESFQQNKPWDAMVREMLAPHAEEDTARGAGLFVSKRLENYGQNAVDYPALVRDVGRLFLGVDLQCAQCHDHPQIDGYKQVDYQGLYAYFQNVALQSGAKYPAVQEKPTTMKIEFQSVFVPGKHEVGPRIPFGMEVSIPMFDKGQEFELPPDKKKNLPGVLKFSPLRTLASDLPRAETPGFSRNLVNRMWWLMMGRGLVHPLDLHHAANAPSHPELLELLANDFAAHKFDIRYLLRELALSQTYQRSSELPEGAGEISETSYRVALEKGLSPEQMARSLWIGTGPWTDEKAFVELRTRSIKAFAQPPREPEVEFAPGVKGSLFLSHDTAVLQLLEAKDGNLADRLSKLKDDQQLANECYLSLLSRQPSDDERREFVDFLSEHAAARDKAIQQQIWALFSSNEFAINH